VAGLGAPPFPGTGLLVLPAQGPVSGAQVIGLANAGGDTINSIKQAAEFGVTKQSLAGLLMFITDVHSLGLKTTQGMYLTEGFYWDLNDETRAWSKRFFDTHKRMPTMVQAGQYSVGHALPEGRQGRRHDDTAKVMAQMKKTPVNDFFAKNGRSATTAAWCTTCTCCR
jgi:branched-chain amino acid transport system substrate-binding protein